jgi:hypothetical protein
MVDATSEHNPVGQCPDLERAEASPQRQLQRGHYLAMVTRKRGLDRAAIVVESDAGLPNARTELPLKFGWLFFLRVGAPSLIRCSSGAGRYVPPPRLWILALPPFLFFLIRLLGRARLELKIPLLSIGYITPLSGWRVPAEVYSFRERQAAQCTLSWLGLHDANIPYCAVFDSGDGWLIPPHGVWRPSTPAEVRRVAVVLHLYYPDLWPEISYFLSSILRPFDLIVTHCGLESASVEGVRSLFPHAEVREVENRGRDIGPFISLLNEGRLSDYHCLCKIHTMKCASEGEKSALGMRWRRRAFSDLLGGDRSEIILRMFDRAPGLGMVGPQALRLPTNTPSARSAWGSRANRNIALALAHQMGAAPNDASLLDFFAGSMFWIKPQALDPLRRLNLTRHDFPEERGQLDGELHHVIERLFTFATRLSGRQVAAVPLLPLTPAPPDLPSRN